MHRARWLRPSLIHDVVVNGHGHGHTTLTGHNFHIQGRASGRLVAVVHGRPLWAQRGRLRGPRRVNHGWIPSSARNASRPPTLSWSKPDLTWWSSILSASSCRRRWTNVGEGPRAPKSCRGEPSCLRTLDVSAGETCARPVQALVPQSALAD